MTNKKANLIETESRTHGKMNLAFCTMEIIRCGKVDFEFAIPTAFFLDGIFH